MSDEMYEVDPSEQKDEEQIAKNKILRYVIIACGVIFSLFVIFWLMLRLNYKLNEVRDGFWPTLKWTFIVVIGLVIITSIVMFLINIIGKKGSYDQHYIEEKTPKK